MSGLGPSRSPLTQVRLRPSTDRDDTEIADLDLSRIDEDPITYFLTPAAASYGQDPDAMDFEMEFDAGIEDSKHPPIIVRSVSPSSLLDFRTPTPPQRSVSPDADRDMPPTPEDYEDYMQLAARTRFGLPFSLKDLTTGKLRALERQSNNLDTPSSSKASQAPNEDSGNRPLRAARVSHGGIVRRGRPRSGSFRCPPHAWREPSPDVWSISEETEEELNSEMGDSTIEGDTVEFDKGKGIDVLAAKPRKRVRFVLPDSNEELGVHY